MREAPPLARELARRLRERFRDRVRDVILFGSYARGEAHEDSDIDVLALIAGLTRAEKVEIIDLATDLALPTGMRLSVLSMDPDGFQDLVRLEARLARDVQGEGIAL